VLPAAGAMGTAQQVASLSGFNSGIPGTPIMSPHKYEKLVMKSNVIDQFIAVLHMSANML